MTAKTFISLFTAILLLSSSAWGQDGDYPKTEFFGGFSYLNADLNVDFGRRHNLFGWQVSISDNFHENVGLVVELEGDVLKLGWLDDDWLQEKLESGETDIKFALPPGGDHSDALFIGSTEELQRFHLKYAGDEDAFEWDEFQRQK